MFITVARSLMIKMLLWWYRNVCEVTLSFSFVKVVDCRICGDPHSVLRFAFVEFADDRKFGCWNLEML